MISPRLTFDTKTHTFTHGGVRLNSVVRILIHSGLVDTTFMAPGVEYLDRGTTVHDYTARYDLGEPVDLRGLKKRWRGFYRAWLRFRVETEFEPILTEHYVQRLYDGCDHKTQLCYCYAGILDRLGRFKRQPDNGILTILDLKNMKTGRVGNWVRYQLVGYGHALNPGTKYHRVGVALHEDGTYAMTGEDQWPITTWDLDLAKFLRASRDANLGKKFMENKNAAENAWA